MHNSWQPKPGDKVSRPRRIKRFHLRRVLGVAADVFKNMGALSAVSSLLAFMFAHASILSLRIRSPELARPFKLGWNIKVKERELPLSAIIGLAALAIIWFIILITQPYSRWVGLAWMVGGLIIYYLYRRRENLPPNYTPKSREESF